jgi:ABC-type amino acid transport substrate-binding protein
VSDDSLSRFREEPRPEFARRLEERLREIDAGERERPLAPGPYRRLVPALAGAALVAGLAFAFTLEPVRAAAREFLDLFRVKRFAAVPVDPERLARLAQGGLDLKTLVAGQVQVVVPPEEPQPVDSPEAGGVAAGIEVRQPAYVPRKAERTEVVVGRPGAFRVQLDTARLEALAQAVGAEEIEIPAWWNGATIDVEVPPVVAIRYARPATAGEAPDAESAFVLFQSRTPEVELPEGFDLAVLGELGLRMSGMDAVEARMFARAIDWRSTLLVPVPVRGQQYREVEVRGQKGLLVSFRPEPRMPDRTTRRAGWRSMLLWSEGDLCFALQGPGEGVEVLEMAQSIR